MPYCLLGFRLVMLNHKKSVGACTVTRPTLKVFALPITVERVTQKPTLNMNMRKGTTLERRFQNEQIISAWHLLLLHP